jgi:hypothetical protein
VTEITATPHPREVASEAGEEGIVPPAHIPPPPSTGIIPSTLSLIERIARDPTIEGWATWPPPCAAS